MRSAKPFILAMLILAVGVAILSDRREILRGIEQWIVGAEEGCPGCVFVSRNTLPFSIATLTMENGVQIQTVSRYDRSGAATCRKSPAPNGFDLGKKDGWTYKVILSDGKNIPSCVPEITVIRESGDVVSVYGRDGLKGVIR